MLRTPVSKAVPRAMQCVTRCLVCPFPCLIVHFFRRFGAISQQPSPQRSINQGFPQDMASLQAIENQKWAKEPDTYEDHIQNLEADLSLSKQAHLQLEEKNQENFMLTIKYPSPLPPPTKQSHMSECHTQQVVPQLSTCIHVDLIPFVDNN
jgi:hypothetical protein